MPWNVLVVEFAFAFLKRNYNIETIKVLRMLLTSVFQCLSHRSPQGSLKVGLTQTQFAPEPRHCPYVGVHLPWQIKFGLLNYLD